MTSAVEPYAVFAQKGVGGAVPGAALLVTWNGAAWSATKADIDAARARGYRVVWAGSATPTANDGLANGDMKDGVVVSGIVPVQTFTVTYTGSAWDKTPAQVSAARAAGQTIMWAGTTVLPTTVNGLGNGDTITGTFTQTLPVEPAAGISIPTNAVPVAVDLDGATSDTIKLTRVYGVTWLPVNGMPYPSGSMTGSTQNVPHTTGANTTVAAIPENANFKIIDTVTSWPLTFTDEVVNATTVTLQAAEYPTASNGDGVASDTITLTSVTDVTWTIDGIDYPSSTFTGTKILSWFAGTNVTVTAKGSRPGVSIGGTSSWPLTFTNAGTLGTPMTMKVSSDFATIPEGSLGSSPFVGGMNAAFGGNAGDLSHNGNAKLSGYTGGGSLYLNGYGPSVTFTAADIIKTRAVEARIFSPQTGTKANGSRLELHKTTGNGVSLLFANADVKVETYGTAWTTLSTLTGLGARDAVWLIAYDDATHKITVKKGGAVVYTGDYTYSGTAGTSVKYTAESGSYSTTIDDVKVWSA